MCEVMPTISEAEVGSNGGGRGSGSPLQSDSEGHFESLMVSMLEERDRLLDTLRETQENMGLMQGKLQEVSHERDALQRQLNSALPQVRPPQLPPIRPSFPRQRKPTRFRCNIAPAKYSTTLAGSSLTPTRVRNLASASAHVQPDKR